MNDSWKRSSSVSTKPIRLIAANTWTPLGHLNAGTASTSARGFNALGPSKESGPKTERQESVAVQNGTQNRPWGFVVGLLLLVLATIGFIWQIEFFLRLGLATVVAIAISACLFLLIFFRSSKPNLPQTERTFWEGFGSVLNLFPAAAPTPEPTPTSDMLEEIREEFAEIRAQCKAKLSPTQEGNQSASPTEPKPQQTSEPQPSGVTKQGFLWAKHEIEELKDLLGKQRTKELVEDQYQMFKEHLQKKTRTRREKTRAGNPEGKAPA